MGSVISDYECPKCGNPHAYEEFYYSTNEVYRLCDKCGYYFNHHMVFDEVTHKPKLLDPTQPECWDNYIFNTSEVTNPYGSLIISHEKYGEVSSLGSIEEFNDVFDCLKTGDLTNVQSITLNRVVDGEEIEIDVLKLIKDEIQER